MAHHNEALNLVDLNDAITMQVFDIFGGSNEQVAVGAFTIFSRSCEILIVRAH